MLEKIVLLLNVTVVDVGYVVIVGGVDIAIVLVLEGYYCFCPICFDLMPEEIVFY